jgi:hypothetical protein
VENESLEEQTLNMLAQQRAVRVIRKLIENGRVNAAWITTIEPMPANGSENGTVIVKLNLTLRK